MNLDAPSIQRFANPPTFSVGEWDALEEYADSIDFKAVFDSVKNLLGCRRSEMTDTKWLKKRLKKVCLRVHPDKGGDRRAYELVQKMRAINEYDEDDCPIRTFKILASSASYPNLTHGRSRRRGLSD